MSIPWRILVSVALVLSSAASVHAKSYTAERFDSRVRVLGDGSLEVTETVTFRFESGSFTHVFRTIPTRRTDGIEVRAAGMDGRPLPFGRGPNEVEVTRKSGVRVYWRFNPISDSSHTFDVTYIVRGVIQQTDEGDLLAWRPLPTQHSYRIEIASVRFEFADTVREQPRPEIKQHRITGAVTVQPPGAELAETGAIALVTAGQIRQNGWIETRFRQPRGSLVAAPPEWQQRENHAHALAPKWAAAAVVFGALCMIPIFAVRRQYEAPPRDTSSNLTILEPPDELPPALAGTLAKSGQTSFEHAMAALFALAERDVITIEEATRGIFGQRNFSIRRSSRTVPLSEHESVVLDLAFKDSSSGTTVPFTKARQRIGTRLRGFKKAILSELASAGLIDAQRQRARQRTERVALGIMALAVLGFIGAAFLVPRYWAWPLLPPAAMFVVALVGIVMAAASTILSNEGLRRAARWRGFYRHLKEVTQDRAHLAVQAPARILPLAVALGLAGAWAKYTKRHPGTYPAWFHALSASEDDGAFAAFVAAGGAAAGGAAGGGAAGGGGSGAG